jgi:hypothetical protein
MTDQLEVLIIGTGRCGTGFLAKSLDRSGISCGHESIFNHWDKSIIEKNINNNKLVAEAAWPAVPFIGTSFLKQSVKIIHLVRHPMHVIRSFHDLNFFSQERVSKPLNQIVYQNTTISADSQDRLISSVKHYFEWNNLAITKISLTDHPYIRVKLEDIIADDEHKLRLTEFIGRELNFETHVVNEKKSEKDVPSPLPCFQSNTRLLMAHLSEKYGCFGYDL